ncbi:MAG: TOBE domain-containing protein [Actinomycetota bacterium]
MASQATLYRIGEAASMLGVRPETIRRWERSGKIKTKRTKGGQRMVPAGEVARLLARKRPTPPPIGAQSARNRFPGVVTSVQKQGLVAVVEILAGPHRVVALTTREAVEEMKLRPGMRAVAAVKSTAVVVELPA